MIIVTGLLGERVLIKRYRYKVTEFSDWPELTKLMLIVFSYTTVCLVSAWATKVASINSDKHIDKVFITLIYL